MVLLSFRTRRALARFDGRPRKAAALACVALALASALLGNRSGPVSGTAVIVAARDLPAGTELVAADLASATWPDSAVPPGAMRAAAAAVGERIGAPVGRGEALTAARLLGKAPLSGLPVGEVAVMVPAGTQGLVLRAGDLVDVYASAEAGESPISVRVIAASRILAFIPPGTGRDASTGSYALIAVDDATAARFARTSTADLTVVLRSG